MVEHILEGLEWLIFFPPKEPSVEVLSDASGSFGCGGFWAAHGWFQVQWQESWLAIHITAKELLPIVIASALWGHRWTQQRVRFRSDNSAVVCLLNSLQKLHSQNNPKVVI